MRTIEEISKDLSNLVFSKCCEETEKVLNNLKLKNINILLNNYDITNNSNTSLIELNKNVLKFVNSFSDLLTDNILDNFGFSPDGLFFSSNLKRGTINLKL